VTKVSDMFISIESRLERIEDKLDDLTVQVTRNETNIMNMKAFDAKVMTFISAVVYGLFRLVEAFVFRKP